MENSTEMVPINQQIGITQIADVLFIAIMSIICAMGVFFNSYVIITIMRTPSLRAPPNVFVASLGVVDLLTGVIIIPITLVSRPFHRWTFSEDCCQITGFLGSVFDMSRLFYVMALSVDRCIAVRKPLQYTTVVTRVSTCMLSLLLTMTSVAISVTPLYDWGRYTRNYVNMCSLDWGYSVSYVAIRAMVAVVIPAIVTLVILVLVYQYAVSRHRIFSVLPVRTLPLPIPIVNQSTSFRNTTMKAFRCLVTIFGVNVSLGTPYVLVKLIQLSRPDLPLEHVLVFLTVLTYATTVANPIMIIAFNRTLKEKLYTTLCRSPSPAIGSSIHSPDIHSERVSTNSWGDRRKATSSAPSFGSLLTSGSSDKSTDRKFQMSNQDNSFNQLHDGVSSPNSSGKDVTKTLNMFSDSKSGVRITLRPPTPNTPTLRRAMTLPDYSTNYLTPVD